MEGMGKRITGNSGRAPRTARRFRTGLLLLGGALALGGCYVVPVQPAYVAPGPVIVAPAPVYRWHGHGWYGHGWHGHGWRGHGRHW